MSRILPRRVRATAPTRICDCGGWSDIKDVTNMSGGGAVSLLTVDLCAHVLVARDDPSVPQAGAIFDITNYVQQLTVPNVDEMTLDGEHALLMAALERFKVRGVKIKIYSDAPPASGVGSSAAVAVALCGALAASKGLKLTPLQIAAEAQALEMVKLKVSCGLQDQYGSAIGGQALFMRFKYPHVTLHRRPILDQRLLRELNERMVLVYVGRRRSADYHRHVIANYRARHQQTYQAMERLKELAVEADNALVMGELEKYVEICTENTHQQKLLAEEVVPPEMEKVIAYAHKHGSFGYKVNGAGGKGTVVFFARPGREGELKCAFAQGKRPDRPDAVLIPCNLTSQGLEVWEI